MNELFLKALNLSIVSGYIVIALIILRPLLKKIPKKFCCALWAIVGLRLVLPFSFESVLSLIPSKEPITSNMVGITSNISNQISSNVSNSGVTNSVSAAPLVGLKETFFSLAPTVWLIGIAVMLIYAAVSYIKVRRSVSTAVHFEDKLWQCETVQSPFILGVISPKIYLPFGLSEAEISSVSAHEYAHIKRCDHLIKPLAFILLSVYWFNPLLWVAYALLCKDIELACDEKVIKEMEQEEIKIYAKALLDCSVNKKSIAACPLAFGENGIKERVKSAINYKRPAFWLIAVSLVVCIVLSVCFLTKRPTKTEQTMTFPLSTSSSSDYEGVSVEMVEIVPTGDDKHLTVKINNGSDYTLNYGEEFDIIDVETGKSAYTLKERIFRAVAYIVASGEEEQMAYSLENFKFEDNKEYRFEMKFLLDNGEEKSNEYNASFSFKMNKSPAIMKFTAVNGNNVEFNYYDIFEGSEFIASTSFAEFFVKIGEIDDSGVIISVRDINDKKTDSGNFLLTSNGPWHIKSGETTVTFELVDGSLEGVYEVEETVAQNPYISRLYTGEGETYIINSTLDITVCYNAPTCYPFDEEVTRTSLYLGKLQRVFPQTSVLHQIVNALSWEDDEVKKSILTNTIGMWESESGARLLIQENGDIYYCVVTLPDEESVLFIPYMYKLKRTDSREDDLVIEFNEIIFESEEVVDDIAKTHAMIKFYPGGTFSLYGEAYSDYIATGWYQAEDDKLFLHVGEDEMYYFKIVDKNTISFISKGSKNYGQFKFLKNGFVFKAE